jgi:hypothetical protein
LLSLAERRLSRTNPLRLPVVAAAHLPLRLPVVAAAHLPLSLPVVAAAHRPLCLQVIRVEPQVIRVEPQVIRVEPQVDQEPQVDPVGCLRLRGISLLTILQSWPQVLSKTSARVRWGGSLLMRSKSFAQS